jgi:hypothetical protein
MPQSPAYRLKRWLDHRPFRSAMCSMGGVGSTALGQHLLSFADKTHLEHAWSPVVYDRMQGLHLGYLFGNPYNAALSVFRRNEQQMHAEAMNANSPTPAARLKGMGIEEYLERGVDEFRIERQFDNWTNPANARHPTLLIRYEALGGSIEAVLRFFECTKPFAVQGRSSQWMSQPEHVRRGLVRMYGGLFERIEAMPPVVILHGTASFAAQDGSAPLAVARS